MQIVVPIYDKSLCANKLLINYQILGDRTDKLPLVVLHGWRSDLNQWLPVAKILSRDNRVVLLDLPGRGQSEVPKFALSTYGYADFVKLLLKKLNISKYTLVGHSFGGRVAIVLASEKNSQVDKLILVDSAGIEEKLIKTKVKIKALKTISKVVKPFVPRSIFENARNSFGSRDYKESGVMRETFVKVVNEDLKHLLPTIHVPTLIVWGSDDQVLDVKYARVFRSNIINSKIKIVYGSNHWPHIYDTQEFSSLVKEFLINDN